METTKLKYVQWFFFGYKIILWYTYVHKPLSLKGASCLKFWLDLRLKTKKQNSFNRLEIMGIARSRSGKLFNGCFMYSPQRFYASQVDKYKDEIKK